MEQQKRKYNKGEIDLFFGDEVQISEDGNVPYGGNLEMKILALKQQKAKS